MHEAKAILIVEDNEEVARMLREHLEREGYVCQHVVDGAEALAAIKRAPPDMVLLDRGLPRVTGDEVVQRLRSDPLSREIPVIMLTGRADESDQLVGFALGADDYVAKPFSPKLLLARMSVQFRLREGHCGRGDVSPATSVALDRAQARVFVDDCPVALTTVEYRLLATLMAAGGHVLNRRQIAAMVWQGGAGGDARKVDSLLGGLQRKLGPAAGCIQSAPDGGFAFCPPHTPCPGA